MPEMASPVTDMLAGLSAWSASQVLEIDVAVNAPESRFTLATLEELVAFSSGVPALVPCVVTFMVPTVITDGIDAPTADEVYGPPPVEGSVTLGIADSVTSPLD